MIGWYQAHLSKPFANPPGLYHLRSTVRSHPGFESNSLYTLQAMLQTLPATWLCRSPGRLASLTHRPPRPSVFSFLDVIPHRSKEQYWVCSIVLYGRSSCPRYSRAAQLARSNRLVHRTESQWTSQHLSFPLGLWETSKCSGIRLMKMKNSKTS